LSQPLQVLRKYLRPDVVVLSPVHCFEVYRNVRTVQLGAEIVSSPEKASALLPEDRNSVSALPRIDVYEIYSVLSTSTSRAVVLALVSLSTGRLTAP
jgi:hypothetical protein